MCQQGVGVGVKRHQIAHVGFADAKNTIVQGDEVVVVLVFDDMVDEAVVNRDVAMDDASTLGFAEVDLEVSDPDHAVAVFKGVFDFEVHAGMDEDIVLQLVVVVEVSHPFDIVLGDVAGAFAAETLVGFGGTHSFP